MDDVDRLFECFKCGITPPQSAVRERKRSKSKLKPGISMQSIGVSPESAPPKQKRIATGNHSLQKSSLKTEKGNYSTEKKFSPVVFYGSPNGVPPKRPSRLLLRALHEIRADHAEQSKSSLSKEVWSTFPRQDEAMKFARGHEHSRVFSYQDHFNGQRRFLVSTYEEFWKRYKNMDSKFRHHYEVIQEGLPCHLYFDLEFNRKDNAERDGSEMVDLLISVIFQALLEKYAIEGNHEWVVELDSSNDVKFSRHLIIRIPRTAFKDNTHAGAFVNELCSRISSAREKDKHFEKLFIRKESSSADSPDQLFVDTAVYSRNRCFRLALSSKAGKTSVLLPTRRYKAKDMCEEDMFMSSLICNMDVDCEKFLICKMDLDCVKTLQFDTEVNESSNRRYSTRQELMLRDCMDASMTYLMGKSPFPALDAFIESVASTGNLPGKIRSWYLFSDCGLMVYSMLRNRYCERIGREHKSNHEVMGKKELVLLIQLFSDKPRAVTLFFCSSLFAPGYRSPLRTIPWEVIPDTLPHEGTHSLECNNDEDNANDSTPESWWLEAVRLADKVERKQNLSQLNMIEDLDGEDNCRKNCFPV